MELEKAGQQKKKVSTFVVIFARSAASFHFSVPLFAWPQDIPACKNPVLAVTAENLSGTCFTWN